MQATSISLRANLPSKPEHYKSTTKAIVTGKGKIMVSDPVEILQNSIKV